MSKLNRAVYEVNQLYTLATRDQWMNRIHPLVKLIITVLYLSMIVWMKGFGLKQMILAGIFPLGVLILSDLSIRKGIYRIRWVLVIFIFMGLSNLFFDREPMDQIGGFTITSGMIVFVLFLLRGVYCGLTCYWLVATTTIEKLCYAMRLLHIPSIIVTQIQLMYRFIGLLMKEAHQIEQAYMLRAPRQKGIHFKVWGSLLGQLLLRSIDRAKNVYESMLLRGFDGRFYYDKKGKEEEKNEPYSS